MSEIIKDVKRYAAKTISYIKRYGYPPLDDEKMKKYYPHRNSCFVLATGPSINKLDLTKLQGKYVIGVNTAVDIPVDCVFYVVADKYVYQKHKKKLKNLPVMMCESAAKYWKDGPYLLPIKPLGSMNIFHKFAKRLSEGSYSGGTVVVHALQIAYSLGFEKVFLLGVDCDYSQGHFDGRSAAEVGTAKGKMSSGDMDYVLRAFTLCKKAYEKDGRTIYNCNVYAKEHVFEKISYESAIGLS